MMAAMTERKPPAATPAPEPKVDPYHELDPIPQPDVQERASETVWALWSEVREQEQARYADTVPFTPGATVPPVAGPAARGGPSGADKLAEESRRNNRVCPNPEHWRRLDALLRAKAPAAAATLPVPLQPREIQAMSALARRSAFRGVVDWAAANGLTEDALQFLRALPEAQWQHLGE